MTIPLLRDYQINDFQAVRAAWAAGKRRPLLVEPTGAGKGTLAAYMTARAVERGKRVVFLVNRRTIVKDFSKRLDRLGVEHGLYLGSQTRQTYRAVNVASIDTLRRRSLPNADLIFVDEAHFAVSDSWRTVLNGFAANGAYSVLMTATPILYDGRGLGSIADVLIQGPTVAELTERGYLVPARAFAPSAPDLTGVHTSGGDYNQGALAAAVDKPKLVGDIVSHWKPFSDRPTVVFAVNCEHGRHIEKEFNDAGYRFRFVDANTPDDERNTAWRELNDRTIQGVVSVGIISYGWDVPCVSCAVLARPTKSLSLYLQQCGRVLRPDTNKRDAIILDHAGNTLRHGFIDDPREWSLDGKKRKTTGDLLPPELLPRVCPNCMAVSKPRSLTCPCGYVFSTREAMPEHIDGTLSEIKRVYRPSEYPVSDDPAVSRIIEVAKQKGWSPGAVWHKRKALETARSWYRETLGYDPQPHWNAAIVNRMVDRAKASVVG